MFNGKMKAVTFSYDDGVTQDIRLIEIFNRYNLKATFNINSELLGKDGSLIRDNVQVSHIKNKVKDVSKIYEGHEIAAHTLTHPALIQLSDDEVIRQVEQDRLNLSDMAGYEVVGMAYPGGGTNYDKRVANIIKENTGIKYARSTVPTYNFELQENYYEFKPTLSHTNFEKLFELGEQFVNMKTDRPQIYYIWGHSYEFDIEDTWDKFEDFCKLISNRDDIFYGTNSEVLLENK